MKLDWVGFFLLEISDYQFLFHVPEFQSSIPSKEAITIGVFGAVNCPDMIDSFRAR